jgi:hypothetical protein
MNMKTVSFTVTIITAILIFFSLGVFVSCKEESKKKGSTTNSSIKTSTDPSEINSSEKKGDIAYNPPHGQPGHQCGIPVGARINSSTTPNSAETRNFSPVINSGEVKLNPAHGQPGHRCDIEVGAPLDSSPSKSSANTQSGSPAINSGEVKLNPAHGQPGHRCDIKVGDPLIP